MITEAARVELAQVREGEAVRSGFSELLSKTIFVSLLALIAFAVIPYGTAQVWWKAFFISLIFAVSILWIIDGCLISWRTGGGAVLLPLILLAAFAAVQTIPSPASAISADVYATQFFVLQLLALILLAALLFRYSTSEGRIRTLAHVIIAVAVASAIFAILRQTTQGRAGFILPLLGPDRGYGQFINRNHFAFLMEMGLGLTLGMIVGGGIKRERLLIYLGALFPIWTALVLCNSRGGLLAMLAQVISAGLLLTTSLPSSTSGPIGFLRSWPARVAMLLVLVVGVGWGTLWLGGDRLAARMEDGQPAANELRSNARRSQIWQATWRMFAAHPVAGVGFGGYWAAIPTYHDGSGLLTPQEAHNDYLEILASGGIVGFALAVWFLIIVFRRTRQSLRQSFGFRRSLIFGATLGIVGVAVHSLADFGLHMFANTLIFTALVVMATAKVEARTRNVNA